MRPSKFIFYLEWLRTMDDAVLTKSERSRLIDAIVSYADTGVVPTLPRLLMAIFSPIKGTLDRDMDKYNEIIERNRENGKKGGRPKTQNNPEKPSGFLENPEKPNNKHNNKLKDNTYSYPAEPNEKEKTELFEIFFWRNLSNPIAELERFLDYNGKRKWKALDTPTKRMAAATEWQPQDSKPRVRQEFLDMWYTLYRRIRTEGNELAAHMIDCAARIECQNTEAKLRIASKPLRDYIEAQKPPEIREYIGNLRLTTAAP